MAGVAGSGRWVAKPQRQQPAFGSHPRHVLNISSRTKSPPSSLFPHHLTPDPLPVQSP